MNNEGRHGEAPANELPRGTGSGRAVPQQANTSTQGDVTVLCTNGLQTKALCAVRSLGARGVRVLVADRTPVHPSRFSKYAAGSRVYPDPARHPDQFLEWLCEATARDAVDVLFAMDDDVLQVVVPRQAELKRLCRLRVPPPESYRLAADKALTMQLAEAQGIRCPRTFTTPGLDPNRPDELKAWADSLRYPVAVKPRVSSGSRGVRFASTAEEFTGIYTSVHRDYPFPVVQQYIPCGGKYGVCLIYDDQHQLQGAFVQREVRHFPGVRGPSVVRESVENHELLSDTVRLLEGIPWRGVVEVDWMVDAGTGEAVLMEINPRYWSSLHLAVACGVDFPWMDFQLALGETPDPVEGYPLHRFGRQLVPGDLLHRLTHPWPPRLQPPFLSRVYDDDLLSRDDPGPAWGLLLSALRASVDPRMWRFLLTR
ncbi:MAG: ATP-grasp domain-containing protein [Alicyclobacillus sp.]|nr:ATP-grasp domain-containing protein [Alicyclobacillus sp.]